MARPPSSVLITGASTGIGLATVRHLAAEGWQVLAGVEPGDAAPELPEGVQRLSIDVADDGSIAAAADAVAVALDGAGLGALVNNAGVGIPGPLELLDPADLRRQLDVNVVGQVVMTQALLALLRRGGGRIVFIGSVGGVLAAPFAGAYHASKFAMEAIADVWRQELEPEELEVILVEPAAITTPIWDKAIARIDALVAAKPAGIDRYRDRLAAFRESLGAADEHGQAPQDVAEAIGQALAAERPDSRVVVGGAGRLATALRPLVPDRLADAVGERVAKP